MFQKKFTWVLFAMITVIALLITWHYFPQANSLVTLNITMNREEAQHKAQELANLYSLGPTEHYTATIFDLEDNVRNYIELEAGGRKAFESIISQKLYAPYTWQVRHFMPENPHEVTFIFTPEGNPYGFQEVIAETVHGAALDFTTARILAESAAQQWDISFTAYTLIESSQKIQESGRVDHTFTYEDTTSSIGEARYRLQLIISGNRLTTLKHLMYIPEFFHQRYQEMRSANDGIASIAKVAVWLIYFFLCCFIWMFVLLRARFIVFKPALLSGVGLALLVSLSLLNYLPLTLFSYNTALSFSSFIINQITQCMTIFILYSCIYSLSIIVAESLGRKAFGHHPQLWRVWELPAASSSTIVGMTIAGYLAIPLLLAYSTVLYLTGNSLFGWWSPADTLANPNVLATYFPWFSPLAHALAAGFWEECLFRAVPLATAALIGRKLGHERLFLGITLLVQALIFGAAHADYLAQPSYVRIIELFVPFVIFGCIYLRYGLLPIIIAHSMYDAILMALPLFVSSAAGSYLQIAIVMSITSIPLLVIIIQAVRKKQFLQSLPAAYNNSAWHPTSRTASLDDLHPIPSPLPRNIRFSILLGGVVSLIAGYFLLPYQDVAPITMNKQHALAYAEEILQQKNIVLDSTWQRLFYICSPEHEFKYGNAQKLLCPPHTHEAHNFIWQNHRSTYHALLNNFLLPPCWAVRYAQFEGDLANRTEEYILLIDNTGMLRRLKHILPELQAGDSLDEHEARLLAQKALQKELFLDQTTLTEISACSIQHPARRDWTFTFFDHTQKELPPKAARVSITIAGNTITDAYRFIHVPEPWLRSNQQSITISHTITTFIFFLIVIFFIIITSIAAQRWAESHFSSTPLIIMIAVWIINTIFQLYNNIPLMLATLQTSQPVSTQLFILITKQLFPLGIVAAFINGIMASYVINRKHQATTSLIWYLIIGASCAMLYYSAILLLKNALPSLEPYIVSSDTLITYWPWFGFVGTKINLMTTMLLSLFMLVDIAQQLIRKRRYLVYLLLITVSGFMVPVLATPMDIRWWLIECLLTSLFIALISRYMLTRDQLYIPCIIAFLFIIRTTHHALINPIPGAFTTALANSILILGTACMWLYYLYQHSSKDPV